MGPAPTRVGGRAVEAADGAVRLADGTLAGSVLTMDQAVRNLVASGASPAKALAAAASAPARLLGRPDLGTIAPGAPAHVVVLDEELRVSRTLVGGAEAFAAILEMAGPSTCSTRAAMAAAAQGWRDRPAAVSDARAAVRLDAGELTLDRSRWRRGRAGPLLDDPALHEVTGGRPLSKPELEARYSRLVRGAPEGSGATWLNWTIRRRADGRAVGTAQATVTGDVAALAWVVAANGRGAATRARRLGRSSSGPRASGWHRPRTSPPATRPRSGSPHAPGWSQPTTWRPGSVSRASRIADEVKGCADGGR